VPAAPRTRQDEAFMTSDLLSPPAADVDSARATVHYIASVTEELSRLAKAHHLDTLAYLLDMARMEADQLGRAWRSPRAVRSNSHGD